VCSCASLSLSPKRACLKTCAPRYQKTPTGLAQGESRTLRIEPEDAYGPVLAQAVITLPREAGQPAVEEGARVMLSNGLAAKVVIVSDEGESERESEGGVAQSVF
jgi:hypothetical protein